LQLFEIWRLTGTRDRVRSSTKGSSLIAQNEKYENIAIIKDYSGIDIVVTEL